MGTPTTRRQQSRGSLRYARDLTDAEWCLLEPLLPPLRRQGRRSAWPQRETVNAIFYVLRAGCAWRLLPDSFPPWRTVCRWFARRRDASVFESLNHHLVMHDRERAGREDTPTAAVIDSGATCRAATPTIYRFRIALAPCARALPVREMPDCFTSSAIPPRRIPP